jgi:hypothetical protein
MKKTSTILAAMLMVINITKAQWIGLGNGKSPLNANHVIHSITTDLTGNLYAAGEFNDSVGNNVFNYVAKWTGDSVWVKLGTGTHDLKANGYIYTLATDPVGHIYAAGAFTDGQYQSDGNVYVAQWSDTSWTELGASGVYAVPNTAGSAIYSMALDRSGNIYVAGAIKDYAGHYFVSKWNGTTWTPVGSGANALNANNYIHNVVTDPSGNVYVAGDFTDANGSRYVAKWNGTSWSELGTGANALYVSSPINALTTDLSGNVYVGYTDSFANSYIAEWNGSSWAQVGALDANNSINTLTTDAAGNLYAAGNFTDANGEQYVAKWDGMSWTELGTGDHSLNPNSYILTITTDTAYNVYAAGYFTDGNDKFYVAEYDPNTQAPNGITTVKSFGTEIQIAPDPIIGQGEIILTDAATRAIEVSLYDMTGRKLALLYQGEISGSEHIRFDADQIAAGAYLIRVTDGKSSQQGRFVKL